MSWVALSLACALSAASVDALSKHLLRTADERVVAWARWAYAAPFLLPLLWRRPALDAAFLRALLQMLPLEALATLLYVRALRLSPLSLALPLLSLTPVFSLLTALLLLGEVPGRSGLAGVAMVAAGGYLLQASERRHGPLAPLRAVLREPGSRLMMGVAFIYSLTSALGKVAALHSEPQFFGALYTLAMSASLWPLAAGRRARAPRGELVLLGALHALMVWLHWQAICLTQVSYMIALKRTSLLFGTLYGGLLFGEEHLGERLAGGALMALGAALIAL